MSTGVAVGGGLRFAKARTLRYYTKPFRLILTVLAVGLGLGGLA